MPIYSYKCSECKTEYDVLYLTQSSVETEEPDERCPKCQSKKKERLISRKTGFSLKGKWFKQGY